MYSWLARFCRQLSQTGHGLIEIGLPWCRAIYNIESILFNKFYVMCIPRVMCRHMRAHVCHGHNHTRFPAFLYQPGEPGKRSESNDKAFTWHTHSLHQRRECGQWAAAIINKTPYLWELTGTALSHVLLLLRSERAFFFVRTHEQHRKIAWIFVSNSNTTRSFSHYHFSFLEIFLISALEPTTSFACHRFFYRLGEV